MRILTTIGMVLALAAGGCGEDTTGSSEAGGDGDGDADAMLDAGSDDPVVEEQPVGDPPKDDPRDEPPLQKQCTVLIDYREDSSMPSCDAATLECLQACGEDDEQCPEDCIAGDSSDGLEVDGQIDCDGCVSIGMFACFADSGCDDEVNAFMCCFEGKCLKSDAAGCVESQCGTELEGMFICAISKSPQCFDHSGDHNAVCFANPDQDAGL